ncbi:hypothetical protein [Pseudomonas aeruginosa]|uniref:hypothetical protein n=1 Tax=Pseudomonas aeruginosa TaxID=287 RepID=UPI0008593C23|nr:hypothetical protein [Pseudomonas aeruginosa]OES58713.1 hypothetical protein A7R78_20765 [Pseudomonas aeruginosa]
MSKELNKAPVEQAGGDERAAFEAWWQSAEVLKCKRDVAMEAWQASAALAQPSPVRSSLLINGYQLRAALEFIAPDGTAKQLESEALIEWRQQDADFLEAGLYAWCAEYPEEGCVLLDEEPTTAQPYPAQAVQAHDIPMLIASEHANPDYAMGWNDCRAKLIGAPSPAQAEAERPEVVAWQYRVTAGPQTGWSLWHPGKGEEFERSYTVERRPLMTVAQHERIVGELRAKLQAAEDRADTLEHRMMGMMTRHFAEAWRNRDTQKALDGYLSAGIAQLEQERDAALAEVERLRQFERICEGLPQDAIDGGWTVQGIRCYAKRLEDQLKSALARVAELEKQDLVDAPGPDEIHQMAFEEGQPAEDGDGYLFSAEEFDLFVQRLLDSCATTVAQAQHSVPDGAADLCRFLAKLYCELDGLRYSTAKLPAEQIADALIFKWPVLQGTRNQLNIKRISEQPYDESKLHSAIAAMLAAAPSKEVGHE